MHPIMLQEQQYCAHNYHPLPVVITKGEGVWLWDDHEKRYLDMMSAYSAVSFGHRHPKIVAALKYQLDHVAVISRAFYSDQLAPTAQLLCQKAGLDKMLPMNTGAEAVETAIKAARRWGHQVKGLADGNQQILVARGNFHGRTSTIISASTETEYQTGFGPLSSGFCWFDFGDIASVKQAYTPNCCAIIVEPIQGEAGIVVPPAGFLQELRAFCDEKHMVLIIDEVQSGFGRTGSWFAFQHEHIIPDGLILGKALGGGLLPVSAFLAKDELMHVFNPGSHGSTFGGNPLAMAVARISLEVMEEEDLITRSQVLGKYLFDTLLAANHPAISAIRGKGLWVGVEIKPEIASGRTVVEALLANGVLSKDTHGQTIRLAPPLTINIEELDFAIHTLLKTLDSFVPNTSTNNTQTHTNQQDQTPPTLMMSEPIHFNVSYSINPWMNPTDWQNNAQQLCRDAQHGWQQLKKTYEQLKAKVIVQAPQEGLPDMVFTANSGVVLNKKALLANFKYPERQGEETHNLAFFSQLKQQGLLDSIHQLPPDCFFEGAGDAIWDNTRQIFWLGFGMRSDQRTKHHIQKIFDVNTISLELTDPRFYHLDTCFCVLSSGEIIYYPKAFTALGQHTIQGLVAPHQLIAANDEDALNLGVNSVCIGKHIVMCYCSNELKQTLENRGYTVHVIDLGAFNRSGGAAYCLTLKLNNLSQ